MGVVLNLADWAVAMYLLIEVFGNVLYQLTQWTVQDQVAFPYGSTRDPSEVCLGTHANGRYIKKVERYNTQHCNDQCYCYVLRGSSGT